MRIAIYCHSIAPSVDGVCRRFTALLRELDRQGHEIMLFTLEENPEDLPERITEIIFLRHFVMPVYPDKKVALPCVDSVLRIYSALGRFQPDIVHVTSDAVAQTFALIGLILNIPVVGSFHTDIIDLIKSHNALAFQRASIYFKETVDGLVLDSCATTSASFAVCFPSL